jgi:hypothetical protein
MANRELLKTLEELGEETIRLKQGKHEWGGPGTSGYSFVSEWLRKKDEERVDAKYSEMLRLARRANTIAMIALIIAIVSIISSIVIAIF